jgi:hypothetical protein
LVLASDGERGSRTGAIGDIERDISGSGWGLEPGGELEKRMLGSRAAGDRRLTTEEGRVER